MSTTAKVLTSTLVGLVILAVTTIGGAIIFVFATPLEPSNPLPGFGGRLPGLLEHLIKYGFKGAIFGAITGGLMWAVWRYYWFRKKPCEPTATTSHKTRQPPILSKPQDAP